MENTRATKFAALPAVVTPGPVRVAVPGAPVKANPVITARPFLPAIATNLDSKFAAAAASPLTAAARTSLGGTPALSGYKRPHSTSEEDTE
jgi:hypothetical protein